MKVYIARQPIYDKYRRLYGYEFLYRDSDINSYNENIDGTAATRTLVSNLVNEFGVDKLTGGHYAFVNFTRELLMTSFPFLLDRSCFVLEVLEDIDLDPAMLERLRELKAKGYKVALDDYVGGFTNEQMESVDILKVDFKQITPAYCRKIASVHGNGPMLLAEKVETEEEFNHAVEIGYSLFQGYYFSKPVPFSKPVTQVTAATCIRLWEEIRRPSPRFNYLTDIIVKDVNLMYKFLFKINTLGYYRGNRVTKIHNTLVRMGLLEIKRWILMILVNDIVGRGNLDRTKNALMRGSFMERLAEKIGYPNYSEEAYLTGMFSVIEADIQSDLIILLKKLQVSDMVYDAVLGKPGILTDLLNFVVTYELCEWEKVSESINHWNLDEGWVVKQYLTSVRYAEKTFSKQGIYDDAPKPNWFI